MELDTLFDYLTLACFLVMAGAFFILTDREPRTLLHLLVSGVAFAVANQLGNVGYEIFASILIAAGIGYAAAIIRQQ